MGVEGGSRARELPMERRGGRAGEGELRLACGLWGWDWGIRRGGEGRSAEEGGSTHSLQALLFCQAAAQ